MKNDFKNELKILKKRVTEMHDLVVSSCEMCGGAYVENLDSATSYFVLDDVRFKMIIEKI